VSARLDRPTTRVSGIIPAGCPWKTTESIHKDHLSELKAVLP